MKIVQEQGHNLLDINDLPALLKFNKRQTNDSFKIPTELLPEPFIGNPESAKVILLALNPGFVGGDYGEHFWHKHEEFKKLVTDNIEMKFSDYPYHYLNEEEKFEKNPGHIWCKRIFKELINEVKNNKSLSSKICLIQFHGYHSKRYKSLGEELSSQSNTFLMVKNAINKGVPIVIMRSRKIWYKAVNELENYREKIILNNPRNPTLSRGNMNENHFNKIVELLR